LFSKQHIKNSLNIPLNGRYAITAANILEVKKKLVIICKKGDENESITRLRRVGFENILGFYNEDLNLIDSNHLISSFQSESSKNIHNYREYRLIDVRTENEYNSKHVKSSINIPLFNLEKNLSKLNNDEKYIIYCRSGYRSSVASSILMKNNIKNFINVEEGILGMEDNKNVNFN
jgi:rhodanese-related sulfurtransferase